MGMTPTKPRLLSARVELDIAVVLTAEEPRLCWAEADAALLRRDGQTHLTELEISHRGAADAQCAGRVQLAERFERQLRRRLLLLCG